MNEFTIAFLLAALLGVSAQDSTLEDRAVNRVQQAPASQYDPTLPSRPFGNWLNQVVGPQSGVSWRLGEYVDQNRTASGWEQGIPACVEATAILPDDRKIVAQIHVGAFKQGLSATTRFHFAVIENDSQFLNVRRLSDLPQLLRGPLSVTRTNEIKKPDEVKKLKIVKLPQIRIKGAPQLYYVKAPDPFDLSKNRLFETVDEAPPPKPAPVQRVSKVITASNALTKVAPTYPPVAKYGRITGAIRTTSTIRTKSAMGFSSGCAK